MLLEMVTLVLCAGSSCFVYNSILMIIQPKNFCWIVNLISYHYKKILDTGRFRNKVLVYACVCMPVNMCVCEYLLGTGNVSLCGYNFWSSVCEVQGIIS